MGATLHLLRKEAVVAEPIDGACKHCAADRDAGGVVPNVARAATDHFPRLGDASIDATHAVDLLLLLAVQLLRPKPDVALRGESKLLEPTREKEEMNTATIE